MGTSEILPVSGPSGSCVALAGLLGNRKSPRKPEEGLFGAPSRECHECTQCRKCWHGVKALGNLVKGPRVAF